LFHSGHKTPELADLTGSCLSEPRLKGLPGACPALPDGEETGTPRVLPAPEGAEETRECGDSSVLREASAPVAHRVLAHF
jgi:hypothetical protein